MTKRKTEADYHALAARFGFDWIGVPNPITTRNTRWRCTQGHEWETTYGNIRKGQGCPHCNGNARLTAEDYHQLAIERGLKWVGSEAPPNNHTKTLWRCEKGHTWEAMYTNIERGTRCPHCIGSLPKTSSDYSALAFKRGFIWLGEAAPENTHSKTRWRCPNGHEWEATYSNINRGRDCPKCPRGTRFTESDYHTLAAKRGFEWIGSSLPPRGDVKTQWRCAHGHEWSAEHEGIACGSGCPYCAGKIRLTEANYLALAKARGFRWLGEYVPQNANTKTSWRCAHGHTWMARYASINKGTGCPRCAQSASKTSADYHTLAAERGFEWVGITPPKNVFSKTSWHCANGHVWEAAFHNINQNQGASCPVCIDMVNGALVSKPQRAVHALIGGELNYPVKRYRIDIALLDPIPIAIEYDCWYWHSNKREHDHKRDLFLRKQGWRILRIRSGTLLPTPEELYAAIQRLIDGETYLEITLTDWKGGE